MLAAFTALAVCSAALADAGGLAPVGCIAKPGEAHDCTAKGSKGLDGPVAVAASPDGKNVYVGSVEAASLLTFKRSSNGSLDRTGCVEYSPTARGCTIKGGRALGGLSDLALSSNGKNLYALADDALSTFKRGKHGALKYIGCISSRLPRKAGCTGIDHDTVREAQALALSPDGRSLYVVSDGRNHSLSEFARAPSGKLSFVGCFAEPPSRVEPECADPGARVLLGPVDVAVSPDGRNVYVVSDIVDAVSVYNRSADGQLEPAGCVTTPDGADGCSTEGGEALHGLLGIAISPDGQNAYVTAYDDGAVSIFTRAADGSLAGAGCVAKKSSGHTASCETAGAQALGHATDLAISSDGSALYVLGSADRAVSSFARDDAGALAGVGCVSEHGGSAACRHGRVALSGTAIALSPDDKNAYVVSYDENAISIFRHRR